MGFGGASTMIAVIKNNRNLLKKRYKFKIAQGDFNITEGKYIYPSTSANELRKLRRRLKEEKKQRQLKIYVLLSFFMIFIITTLIYFG